MPVKVASGRHGYENFVHITSTRAVLDLPALNQAGYDRDRELFFVEAGCANWTAYRTLHNGYGKTLPAGSCYSVGAGGQITGGGWRTPRFGRWPGTDRRWACLSFTTSSRSMGS
jgi:hypothetical protein